MTKTLLLFVPLYAWSAGRPDDYAMANSIPVHPWRNVAFQSAFSAEECGVLAGVVSPS